MAESDETIKRRFEEGREADHEWPQKAYKNPHFLGSPAARSIRILSEFLEPADRFRRLQVRNTIVFFGSARIIPPEHAREKLAAIEHGVAIHGHGDEIDRALEQARRAVQTSVYYDAAAALAERITRWSKEDYPQPDDRIYVCSGGGPGIMEAANLGASRAGGISIGLNISLPFEQMPNRFQSRELSFDFHYFFMRKFWFVYPARALVVFPGGFGTMDELFELLTLVQTGKTRKTMPIVLFGSEFWHEVLHFSALVKWGMIGPEDLALFQIFDDVGEAFEFLRRDVVRYMQSERPPGR